MMIGKIAMRATMTTLMVKPSPNHRISSGIRATSGVA